MSPVDSCLNAWLLTCDVISKVVEPSRGRILSGKRMVDGTFER